MAIDSPEATAGAAPWGPDSTGGTFLPREEWRLCRQGKKVVTTLLRRSGRGEDALRADQPITRGHWTRAGTDNPRRSRRPWRPVRRTGHAVPVMRSPLATRQASLRPLLPRGSRYSTWFRSASVMAGKGRFSNEGRHWAKMLVDPCWGSTPTSATRRSS